MGSTIQQLLNGRDNNFNLIRFLAALAVIYDHSFMVPNGQSVPWFNSTIMSGDFGWYAVNIFFILSGFLVTKSWILKKDALSFGVARSLRLFPALLTATFTMAFIIGPLVCLCLLEHYFSDSQTWLYVPMTASLVSPHEGLPHVFHGLPVDSVVNSPLWTLRYEVISYLALAGLGIVGCLSTLHRARVTMALFFAAYLAVTLLTDFRDESGFVDSLMRFWLCFFLGASSYILANQITFRATTATALLLAATLAYGTHLYELVLQVALAYGTLWVALVPDGNIRKFNELGDYSYGLYIFAWPVQQTAVLLYPALTPHELFVLVVPIVVIVAAVSWHWIEQPVLESRNLVTNWLKQRESGNLGSA